MNTNQLWSIFFLLAAVFISLAIHFFIEYTQEGFTISNTSSSTVNVQQLIFQLQKDPTELDHAGMITTIIQNPTIMNDPTIAAAIANNTVYMKNPAIASNKYVSSAANATPLINPALNIKPLTTSAIQQKIASIQYDPTQLDIPGMITTILNNTSIMNDLTVAAAIVNDDMYINNPIIINYPTIITASENNASNPFLNTEPLSTTNIQLTISKIQLNPKQLDIPGMITTILNNMYIIDDPTVAAAIVNNTTYTTNSKIAQYIAGLNISINNNPFLNTRQLSTTEIDSIIASIQTDPTQLDIPGMITTILNNPTIMNDPTVAAAFLLRPIYMSNTIISTNPSVVNAGISTASSSVPITDTTSSEHSNIVSPASSVEPFQSYRTDTVYSSWK